LAPTELRRFTSRHGARAVLDETSRVYRDAGIGYLKLDDDEIFDRLLADQALLKLPLVRVGSIVAVGVDEKTWKEALVAAA
jgi:arsenate reductase-like glutaredoxin family protein